MAKGPFSFTAASNPPATKDVPINGKTVAILVTGTWSGVLQPQLGMANQAPVNTEVTPAGSTTLQGTITANGLYFCTVAAVEQFLLAVTSMASGTAVVYLNLGV
jgi:hypothetical protein